MGVSSDIAPLATPNLWATHFVIAGAHQPMETDDGLAIVFNCEIYNYAAQRQQLIARG